ncbi:MAG: helix-turn-helix domain-containing protein, partial [Chitinophagaceae bacterium]|nr:helix-turn-helix domain-containing protein [Chitinophagaceae bacterium]
MNEIISTMNREEISEIMKKAVFAVLTETGLHNPNPAPEVNDILSAEEVCALLKLTKGSLYQKTHKNKIPFKRQGKLLLFSRA